MSKVQFREINFKSASRIQIQQMVDIISEYERAGLRLTARQLYYQFVSRDLISNTVKSYKNLTSLLANARYAGLVDWDAIEDRGREPTIWREHSDIQEATSEAINGFRLPRWKDQPYYIELWVEKQALAGVLEPLAAEHHAVLMVNKGYSSASAMYESARRFIRRSRNYGGSPVLFYLGDHDPSGEDMVRDIRDRLVEFGVHRIDVRKLALTREQVDEYEPPPNPAKTTDSRYATYAAEHGDESWEVDALPPDVLQKIIRDSFAELIDTDMLDEIKEKEESAKEAAHEAMSSIVE